jgi:hypothetical protein
MLLTKTYSKKRAVSTFVALSGIILFALLCSPSYSRAQLVTFPVPPSIDSLHRDRFPDTVRKKHFGRAALFLGIAELTPFIYDRYVVKADYAMISWSSTAHNLKPSSWEFDDDEFTTNQFGHPYHGSMFFTSFRANGYSFWQSVPATAAGSYLWETFAENQPPSPNDFINTTFGGVVIGEMTYRLSNKIINNTTTGFKRQANEVLAFLISPMNGLTRIVDGKWGKVSTNTALHDSTKISGQIDLGFREYNVNNNSPFQNSSKGWYAHVKLIYGDPDEGYEKPFSNFVVNAEVGKDDSTALNMVSIYGSLTGWELKSTDNVQHLLILSANYDYIHNAAFFYGGQSVKFNLFSKFKIDNGMFINTAFGAGGILLAGVPDPYTYRGRNYDYESGLAFNAGGTIAVDHKLYYSINYRGGWMWTINGNKSSYLLHNITNELSYYVVKDIAVVAEAGYIRLNGNYTNLPDIDKKYPYFKAAVRYDVSF